MRKFVPMAILALMLAGCDTQGIGQRPADLKSICRNVETLNVHYPTNGGHDLQSVKPLDTKDNGHIFRLVKDELYITDPSRQGGEYLYNNVTTLEDVPHSFRSGLMILTFLGGKKEVMVASRADHVGTTIRVFNCTEDAKAKQ